MRTIASDHTIMQVVDPRLVAVLEGPPNPPLAIFVEKGFWYDCRLGECSEGQAMVHFQRGVMEARGARVLRASLRDVVRYYLKRGYEVRPLNEKGRPLYEGVVDEILSTNSLLVMGAYDDPPSWLLEEYGDNALSVGPLPYLASHAAYFLLKCLAHSRNTSRIRKSRGFS